LARRVCSRSQWPTATAANCRSRSSGWIHKRDPIRKVEIRGVTAKLTTSGVEVTISASVQAQGNRAAAQAGTPSQHISTALMAQGNTTNLSANRIKPSISTSFEIVGCEEDDEAAIRMLAQAALEEFYLQNIVDSYDD
jgi:hypothetical protein